MTLPRPSKPTARRLRHTVGALAVAGATIGLLASPASAAQTCTGQTDSNLCFSLTDIGNRDFAVHIGIDVHMSRQDAQAIIDAPGEPFTARIFGDDPSFDNGISSVPVTWVAAGDSSLSAEFDMVLDGSRLNEDDSIFDDRDEVYAQVKLFDARTNTTRTFTSGNLVGYF